MYTTPFLDLPPLLRAGGTLRLPGSKSISNREELLKQSMRFRHTLDAMEHVIKTGNVEALEDLIRNASDARSGWQMNATKPTTNR